MWHRWKNFLNSVETYSTLSADVSVRRQVNRGLRDRLTLTLGAWFDHHWQSQDIAYPVIEFAYTHLQRYSGLPTGKLRPTDRLNQDLHWIEICSFDWELVLCDDFQACFGIDITDRLDELNPVTIEDVMVFLDQQWRH